MVFFSFMMNVFCVLDMVKLRLGFGVLTHLGQRPLSPSHLFLNLPENEDG